jgi:septum site-determining protein MinD
MPPCNDSNGKVSKVGEVMKNVISVLSGKGGVGKSTVSAGLGAALCRRGKRVLLMDMDISLPSLELILGVSEAAVFNWADVLRGRCLTENALLSIPTQKGLFLLSPPKEFFNDISVYTFYDFVEYLSRKFDYIILDLPAGLTSTGLNFATTVTGLCLTVVTPDNVSVRAAEKIDGVVEKRGIKNRLLIINRFSYSSVKKRLAPNIDEVIDGSGLQLLGVVPDDKNVSAYGVRGETLPSASPAAKAFLRIAGRMLGEKIPLNKVVVKM